MKKIQNNKIGDPCSVKFEIKDKKEWYNLIYLISIRIND